jgi:uncharacterized membrane protein
MNSVVKDFRSVRYGSKRDHKTSRILFNTLLLFYWILYPFPAAWGNSIPPVTTSPEPDNVLFRGHLTIGPAGGSFTQCETNSIYEIIDRTGGDLTAMYKELAYEPEAMVYVEFNGRKILQHPEKLTVLKLQHAAVETRGCAEDLQGFAFRAAGNEPFWHIAITRTGINYSELGKPEIAFPPVIPSVSDNHWLYITETDGPSPQRLAIDIRGKKCRDTMSGTYFSYTAQATLDNQTYNGGARQGRQQINQPTSHQKTPLTALKNAEYSSDWSSTGKVRLKNGIYGEKIVSDSATELIIRLGNFFAFGDLNNDGVNEAAAILITDGGGSGTFHDLIVLTSCNGSPEHAATAPLGDRVRMQSLTIRSGYIMLEMISHGPDDPMASPSLLVRKHFKLEGDQLVQVDNN